MTDIEISDPHAIGEAHGCPEGCPAHNPGGPDVDPDTIAGMPTDEPAWTISAAAGPTLVYLSTYGTAITKVDEQAPADPRERAICRALLQHALALLDASEPTNPNGSPR
ncbi:hypothetical protein [Streptomyces sp. NRRL F-2664]|uniref:hypothetical protein n=1 Tax=Streptomyces sp. NRRL F-2664 TaxID=1463842 RepID=UPI0004C67027|nr:hypothetical protein [Streptomyces sp. NRRL F-2664]